MGWRDVEYRIETWTDGRLSRVVEEIMRTHVNGGVILRHLRPALPGLFREALNGEFTGLPHILRCFLESPTVRAAIPELEIPEQPKIPPHACVLGAFEWEGTLTQLLLADGAYVRSSLQEEEARKLSLEFVDVVSGGDRDRMIVFRWSGPWTEWFYDVAWDRTSVVLNSGQGEEGWWVLCVTDTD